MKYIFSDKKTRKKEKQGEKGIPAFIAIYFLRMVDLILLQN
jgi:hypothetical protein